MKPALPAGTGSRPVLALLAGLAAFKAIGMILIADALATAIAQLAAHGAADVPRLLAMGLLGALLRSGAVWGTQFAARRAGLGAKEKLRGQLMQAGLSGTPGPGAELPGHGALSALASRGLDGLDNYYTKYLPAVVSAMVIPLLVLVRVLVADWVSALVIVLTLPLVPVFMILIGLHTQDRVKAAAAGLDRLSNQLLELAQGLPALIGLRRAEGKGRALARVSEDYRQSSMKTLRTAFLSGLALELIATISVAVVAVFIGVRLVYGNMGLEAGLLALILAPEAYLPLRELGAAYHSSEDGVEALERSEKFIAAGDATAADRATPDPAPGNVLEIRDLTVQHPGSPAPILHGFTLHLAAGESHVLDGPSGTGKSTLLHAVLGRLAASSVRGGLALRPERTAWISQHPQFTEDTVRGEIMLHAGDSPDGDSLNGTSLDNATLATVCRDANIEHLLERRLVDCSPGELRRVAVARVLARVATDPDIELVLADEPTAHLDEVSAARIRTALHALAAQCSLLVATHDRVLASALRGTAAPAPHASAESAVAEDALARVPAGDGPRTAAGTGKHPLAHWKLLRSLPWFRGGMGLGLLLATLAALFGVGLTGISGWLIVTASHQPPMLHLMVAIVGVRTFGLGRAVLHYAEQLKIHDAVLRFSGNLRQRLWDGLAAQPRMWGRLTRSGAALGHLVAEVDEVRDAVPRVLVPPVAGIATWAVVSIGIGFWAPQALPVALLLGLLSLVVLPLAVLAIERRATVAVSEHRIWLGSRVPTLLRAAPDLRANNATGTALAEFARQDAKATAMLRASARGAGLAQGGAALLSALAAVLAVAVTTGAGEPAAVAGLLLLALGEPIANTATSVQQVPQLDDVLKRVWANLDHADLEQVGATPAGAPGKAPETAFTPMGIRLRDARAGWETGTPVFEHADVEVEAGSWVGLTGPSGSGKSTMLATFLGALPVDSGELQVRHGAGEWRTATDAELHSVSWCPQEAHLFDSSIRSNLGLGRELEDQPADSELASVLEQVGLGQWFSALPDGLETRIGSGGHHLSGGQRQRLAVARALVARSRVLLLDEPTAHLGADEAVELIADLRGALKECAVLIVTHDAAIAALTDRVVDLGILKERSLVGA